MKNQLAVVRNLTNQVLSHFEALMYDALPNFDVTFVINTIEKDFVSRARLLKNSRHVNITADTMFPTAASVIFLRVHHALSRIVPVPPVHRLNSREVKNNIKMMQVVNCNEVNSLDSYQCTKLCSKMGIPLAVTVWDTRQRANLNCIPPYSSNAKCVIKYANFLVHTRKAKQYLLNLGVSNEKITLVYPGIDTIRFSPASKKNDNVRILFVGRFAEEKGLSFLLKAYRLLYKEKRNTELWIKPSTAKDMNTKTFESLRKLSKKSSIKVLGLVDRFQLPEIYRNCDIFCAPSNDNVRWGVLKIWDEQFGFVFIEAMACGLPIVSTDCGAIPEVIGKENLIVKQKDVKSLYLALKKLVDDEELRKRLSENNRKRVEKHFNADIQIKKLSEFYLQF